MKNFKQLLSVGLVALICGFLGGFMAFKVVGAEVKDGIVKKEVYIEDSKLSDVVGKVRGAVVSLSDGKQGGTGFVVNGDGLIVTNKHLAGSELGKVFEVTFDDGMRAEAKVVAADEFDDVAFLMITGRSDSVHYYTVVLGDSDTLRVGQSVFAVGNALSLYGNTVTYGIVSAKERQVSAQGDFGMASVSNFYGLLQTDAAINIGNSGGPLVNLDGEVIGMNVAVVDSANDLGFALPINDLKPLIDSFQKYGEIRRPILGVSFLMLNEYQGKEFGVDHGALIVTEDGFNSPAVLKGGPAGTAGLVEGDVILSVNGEAVDAQHPLNRLIRKYEPGANVSLKIMRKMKEMEVNAVLGG